MSIIHDIIKINYIQSGYLPNYPYYLISDKEMINAFLAPDGFFAAIYSIDTEDTTLLTIYQELREAIEYH